MNESLKPLDGGDQIEGLICGSIQSIYLPNGEYLGSRIVRPGSDTQPVPNWTTDFVLQACRDALQVGVSTLRVRPSYGLEEGQQAVTITVEGLGNRLRYRAYEVFGFYLQARKQGKTEDDAVAAFRTDIAYRLSRGEGSID
jgi:hypothetical protein